MGQEGSNVSFDKFFDYLIPGKSSDETEGRSGKSKHLFDDGLGKTFEILGSFDFLGHGDIVSGKGLRIPARNAIIKVCLSLSTG